MTPLLQLTDGSYIQPEHVTRLSPGGPGKDYVTGYTFVQMLGGEAFWVGESTDRLRIRIDTALARIR